MRRFLEIFRGTSPARQDAPIEDCAVTRCELETMFAYELRVANSDMSKIKVYKRSDRFKSPKIVPLGIEHQDIAVLEIRAAQ